MTRLAFVLSFALGALPACSDPAPTFPAYTPDSGLQCSAEGAPPAPADASVVDAGAPDALEAGAADAAPAPERDASAPLPACPSGQVCLDHRCYTSCSTDSDCATAEQCDPGGACVPRTRPRVDAGAPDTGPPDPCEGVSCEGLTPVCNPLLGICKPCGLSLAPGDTACDPRTKVCEVARGQCSDFDSATLTATCGPCNTSSDCAGGGTCLTREAPAAVERVCVPSCDAATPCPRGLSCDPMGVCLPPIGSCFEYRAAADGRGCDATEKCAPIGASLDHTECRGLGAGAVAGVCETACTSSTDCAPGIDCFQSFCHKPTPCPTAGCSSGLECGGDGFCHPLPAI